MTQWIRYAQLIVQTEDVDIDLSDLAFRFEIQATIIQTPRTLNVRIWNVSDTTCKKILDEALMIELKAGYQDSFESIFSGQIRHATLGKEINGTDTFIELQCTDLDYLFKDGFVATNVVQGTSNRERLYTLSSAAGLDPKTIDNLSSINDSTKLPRGRVYYGKYRNHLRTMTAQNGIDWYVENGRVVLVERDKYLQIPVIEINRETGMIGLPTQTLDGIHVRCLLNPNLRIGAPVRLDNNSIQLSQTPFAFSEESKWGLNKNPLNSDGIYKIVAITYDGEIRGRNWYSTIICNSPTSPSVNAIKYLSH